MPEFIRAALGGKALIGGRVDAALGAAADTELRLNGTQVSVIANDILTRMPYAGTVKNLHVVNNDLTAVGSNVQVALRKNGVTQALTVAVGAAKAAGTDTTDTTHTFSVAAGDSLTWRIIEGATPSNSRLTICAELDPA